VEKNIRLQQKSADRMNKKEAKKSHLFLGSNFTEEIKIEKITIDVKQNILNKLREKLNGKYLDEGVCIVCDRITLRSCMTTKSWLSVQNDICFQHNDDNHDTDDDSNDISDSTDEIQNTLFYAMKKTLNILPNENLPSLLISDYDCSDIITELKGLLLSKNGLVHATHPLLYDKEYYLQYCNECLKSLLNGTKVVSYTLPPVHAIANHFFVGHMPENLFYGATWVEHAYLHWSQMLHQLVS